MKTGPRKRGSASLLVRYCQAIDSANRGRVRELVNVRTEAGQRGKGHASALLKTVIEEAKTSGVALLVTVKPYGKSKMDMQALKDWYTRQGFEAIQAEPCVMVLA